MSFGFGLSGQGVHAEPRGSGGSLLSEKGAMQEIDRRTAALMAANNRRDGVDFYLGCLLGRKCRRPGLGSSSNILPVL